MHIVIDTETTGLIQKSLPTMHPDQPHIVQLAAVLAEKDHILATYNTLIIPDGWEVPEYLTNVHGITNKHAIDNGIPGKDALNILFGLWSMAEVTVAHNILFDLQMLVRDADYYDTQCEALPPTHFCTMQQTTNICKIPSHNNAKAYKWPTLTEAHVKLFGKEFEGAHDALADVLACHRIYCRLQRYDTQ